MLKITFWIFFSIEDKNIFKSKSNFVIFENLEVSQFFYKTIQTINNISYRFQGRIQEFVQGGLILFQGKTQHPVGSENPLKSIDFTGSGGA